MCKVLGVLCLLVIPKLIQGGHNFSLVRSVLSVTASKKPWTSTPIFVGHNTKKEELNSLILWLHQKVKVTTLMVDGQTAPDKFRPLGYINVTMDNTISLFFCHGSQDLAWYTLNKGLYSLRRSRLIVILRSQRSGSHKAIYKVFEKLWHHQFLNVLVLHKDQIYSYSPYPRVHFFKVDISASELFPPETHNFRGYVVSTPVENDIPRVFLVHDPRTGRRMIRGYAFRTFVEYLNRHNASLHVSNPDEELGPTKSVNMSRIVQLIMDGNLEISLHPYIKMPEDWGDKSYPLVISPNCLIVPVRNEIPRHMYLIRPFHLYDWFWLLAGLIYITGILYCLSLDRIPRSTWDQRLSLSFLDTISRLLFISSPTRIHSPPLRYFIVSLQLSLLGFIITSWYNIQLDSFLTALLMGDQVDSMEQLVQQQQKVLVKEYEVTTLLRHVEPRLVDSVARLLVGVNASEQVSALLSFNRTYAYPFTEERWQFFAMQQQYAFKPIFRFSSACLGSPVFGYPMRKDCHLQSSLNIFIMRIQDAGLLFHWMASDFNDAMRAGYVKLLDNVLGYQPLDVSTLRLGWYVMGFGWLLSTLVFTCEYFRFFPWGGFL